MKNVVAFGLISLVLCCSQNKPFNPLLGETGQGRFKDGTKFYCEHTSHHPPITNFLLEGPDDLYKLYGYYEFIGLMGKNSLTSGLRGPNTVEFKDGTKIRFNAPDWRIGGTIYGERTIEGVGSLVFEDLKNHLKAVVILGTFKQSGGYFGFNKKSSGSKTDFNGLMYSTKIIKPPTKFGKDQKLPEDLKDL